MALFERVVELSNGVRLPVAERGEASGTPVLLLHGFGDSWRVFEPLLGYLPSTIHAFAVTMRGSAGASRPASGYSTEDLAGDIKLLMHELELERAVVVGASSAGFVARRLGIDLPERILGIVFLGSPALLGDKPEILGLTEIFAQMTDPIDPQFFRDFWLSITAKPIPHAVLEVLVRENLQVPSHVWRESFGGLLQDHSLDQSDGIQAPVLIIWGDRDRTVPLSDELELETRIKHSRLLVYKESGHAFYVEEPERVAADLVSFVQGLHE